MEGASVIHFCSNDLRFLRKNVEEAKKISDCVLIPICDHFFNGEPEDRQKLNWIYREFSDCSFIEFEYDPHSLYSPFPSLYSPKDQAWGSCWNATSRLVADLFAPPSYTHLLFLDADEIVEGDRLRAWLDTKEHLPYSAIRLGSYLYCRSNRRTEQVFSSALLVKRSALDPLSMVQGKDRQGIYEQILEPKCEFSFPFIHHYSWVRTKPECLQKSQTWGHRDVMNWKSKIDRYFDDQDDPHPMGMKFKWCDAPCYFDPLSVEEPLEIVSQTSFPNVRKVSRREAVARMLEKSLEAH